MAQGYWQAGGAGGVVNRNYTAAQLATMAAAGTLEAGTLYEPYDVTPTILYVAITTSQLDALGSQMAYSQLAAQSAVAISSGGLTTVATYSTLGWKYLLIQYKNTGANALAEFELAARGGAGSASFVITHDSSSGTPTSDFTTPDGMLLDCYTDTASADLGVLAAGGNAWIRLNVTGTYEVRLRTKQATADGTADVYATLLA